MVTNRASSQWASTTGLNLVTPRYSKDLKLVPIEGRKFKARGTGFESNGEPRYNEFELVAVLPTKSNRNFTVVKAKPSANLPELEITINHGGRYLVPVNQH